jgi:hypothetical protein
MTNAVKRPPCWDAALPLIFPITANRKLYQQQTAYNIFAST